MSVTHRAISIAIGFVGAIFLALHIASGLANAAPTVSTTIVISQVYGGGGNSGATYKNDFIELFNRGTVSQSLNGWSVQYASSTSTNTTFLVTNLTNVTLAPGQYYLIQEAVGAGGTTNLPTPDATGSINMSATAAKVALVNTTTALILSGTGCPSFATIVDFIGYGTANCSETSTAPAPSNTTAVLRAANGCTDTDNNSADFAAGAPNPRNTASLFTTCTAPAVIGTSPSNGAINVLVTTTIAVTFTQSVTATTASFTITGTVSGAHAFSISAAPSATYTLTPTVPFANGEVVTVTVFANQVFDANTRANMSANYSWTFTTADVLICGDPATRIHDIQGSGLTSPMSGTVGVTIEGVVVGDYQNTTTEFGGFYVQEEDADADADPLTSEGIFVFDNNFGVNVSVGDRVRVKGTVTEFETSSGSGAFLTELKTLTGVMVCGVGPSVTPTTVNLPVSNLSDWERYEGMLVNLPQQFAVTENFTLGRFGEVSLSVGGRLANPTNVTTPGAAAIALQDLNNRSRIVLDDGNGQQNIDPTLYPTGGLSAANTLRDGYTVTGVTGVLEQRFSVYRLQPVGPISFSAANARTAAPSPVGGNLKVAAFNVLNYFNGDGLGGGFPTSRGASSLTEFTRQRTKIISALSTISADVVGLSEIENDATPNSAIEDLVSGLNTAMGAGTYNFINTGVVGTDQIRVAIIYKPATVFPLGAYKILDSSVDPLFIDTKNRPALAQTFRLTATGAKFTVVANHLKSKGSACDDVGDPDTGDGQGNCNLTRNKAAMALVNWLATDPTSSGDPDFLIIGDLNSYAKEDPITTIKNAGYTNLVDAFIGANAYSYVFQGQSGYLDHALANASLSSQVTGVAEWHINADEPIVLDYNVEFKTANQINTFYDPGPYRASDHDPIVIGMNLSGPTAVTLVSATASADGGDWLAVGAVFAGMIGLVVLVVRRRMR